MKLKTRLNISDHKSCNTIACILYSTYLNPFVCYKIQFEFEFECIDRKRGVGGQGGGNISESG